MRVAVVHGLQPGGAARRLAGTMAGLRGAADVTVREFTLAGSVEVWEDREVVPWQVVAPTKPRVLRPGWRYRDAAGVRTAWRQLWSRVNAWGPDVVFLNPCSTPTGAPPGLELVRAPSLYYCDEPRRVDYEPAAAKQTNPLTRLPYLALRRAERRGERASVAAATAVVTNSHFTSRRIHAAYGVVADVVSPGIDAIFEPAQEQPAVHGHVLSVGTLIPTKGHDLAVRAVAASRTGLPLRIVAPRPDPREEARLRELARELGVDLHLHLGVSDHDLLELYQGAVATLYLAREEPLGLVSLESQACGTPVVVAAEGGLLETVVDGRTGFTVDRDEVAPGRALGRLADADVRRTMSHAAATQDIPRAGDTSGLVLARLRALVD